MNRRENKNLRNMTEGNIVGHLLSFAFPMLLGSLLQQLYNMVDSWVVGRFVSEAALAAVGIGYPVVFLFTSLFMGISSGTTVTIAQYYGAGKLDRVRDVVDTAYTFITLAVLPLTAFAVVICRPLLRLMQVEQAAMHDAYTYLVIISAGLVGTIGYNINNGILQGLGNSRASLLFLGVSAVMNIVLDLAFVLGLGWGVEGVAVATIISQACSWLFGVVYINRTYESFSIRPFCFRFDKKLFRTIMGIGLPAGLQMATVSIGMVAVVSQVNAYGMGYTAGYNIGNKLDSMGFLPAQAIAMAATAFVGQNMGAGKQERVRQGVARALTISISWCLVMMAVLYPLRYAASAFFTDSAAAIEGSALFLQCILPFYPFFVVQFTMCNIMRGAGESVVPMLTVMASQVFLRIPSVFLLAHFFGPEYMYYGYGLGWIFGATMTTAYFLSGRWKRRGSLAQ